MKALLIDHDDSFTYNLRDWLGPAFSVDVRNHRDLEAGLSENNLNLYSVIVLSPGPKAPRDYPHVKKFIQGLASDRKVFGVCLGMQILCELDSGHVVTYTPPLHGKKSKIKTTDSAIEKFNGLSVARYHSLQCELAPNSGFKILATTEGDNKPMWLQHRYKKQLAFQFHPESFLTEEPNLFLQYLNDWCHS